MPDDIASAAALPPSEALAVFRSKANVPTQHWDDLWQQAHTRGFMVAGATSDALLADFRAEMDKAVAGQLTLAEFRKSFPDIVKRHGWEHYGTPGWRAGIIYSTNVAMANSAGRYQRMTTPEALEMFPWWMYEHNACQHPRAQHVAWSGTILPANDPWWSTHYPPNGWRCHCTVRMVSRRMMRTNGWSVSERPPVDLRPWRNKRTGEILHVPNGIDPGFAYNPGEAWKAGRAADVGMPGQRFRAEDAGPARPTSHPTPTPSSPAAPPRPPSPPTPAAVAHPDLVSVARQKVQQRAIEQLLHHPAGTVEAGTMPEEVRKALGAETPSVTLSGETIEKQAGHHPDLDAQDYRVLPEMLAHPTVVARQDDRRLLLFRWAGRLYRAVLKATGDGRETYLVSFHRTSAGAARRALRKMTLLRGALDDLDGNGGE
ncbi:hypothetical protein JUN65_02025 [Gluconacetobacter azotocaptans]|uniref:phage head morphogenesis protein n=1 Tax=Gluconacetobacter azotocaptans TaxID=142834 RepID=UPI001959DFB2|nr:phage minor head protein [Gluconacetobacter azotocaptans]MBM9400371.1 hypothetical protein [Gluconacetobacter azotocaptans]